MCVSREAHIFINKSRVVKETINTMQNGEYKRPCPSCGTEIQYVSLDSYRHIKPDSKCRYCCNVLRGKSSNRKGCHHSVDSKEKMSASHFGKKLSTETRIRMSISHKNRCNKPEELQKMSERAKIAMRRPDVRKRHIDALYRTKWLVVKTDNGQLELINELNQKGFHFQPNYPLKTHTDLFYLDGYDSIHNVVLEYDSAYHKSIGQQEKDKVRERKIIDFLQPKNFWRYDSATKTMKSVVDEI